MTEVEVWGLKPGETVVLIGALGMKRAATVIGFQPFGMTRERAMEWFNYDPVTATKRMYDGPIVIVSIHGEPHCWPPYHVKRPDVQLDVDCNCCHRHYTFWVNDDAHRRFMCGVAIQDCFPELSPTERELFISGLCYQCLPGVFQNVRK